MRGGKLEVTHGGLQVVTHAVHDRGVALVCNLSAQGIDSSSRERDQRAKRLLFVHGGDVATAVPGANQLAP